MAEVTLDQEYIYSFCPIASKHRKHFNNLSENQPYDSVDVINTKYDLLKAEQNAKRCKYQLNNYNSCPLLAIK
ncbi:hypothetical protein [Shewanella waksmanii]|uniref:hypothetical protein n=1 Tax=Shewanella waksmanii TaxID=213783 RepID=UPI00373615ED